MNISHDGEYATAVCLSHEPRSDDPPPIVRRVGAVEASAEILRDIEENKMLNTLKKQRSHLRKLAIQLDIRNKLLERDQLLYRLDELEEKVARQENDKSFIQRAYTVPEKQQSERAAKTIFIGNIRPGSTISDLESMFAEFSSSVKAYLYTNEKGDLLGTGAVVLGSKEEAYTARMVKDGSELNGNIIRCLPWFRRSLRKFTQKGVHMDDVYMNERQHLKDQVFAPKEELDSKVEPAPRPLPELEPLPRVSDPQYILVRELFRIQDEYQNRRARGVYVSGLNLEVTVDDLREHFMSIAKNVTVDIWQKNGRNIGSAIVSFETVEEANLAREKMNETLLLGSAITCEAIKSGREELGRTAKSIGRGFSDASAGL